MHQHPDFDPSLRVVEARRVLLGLIKSHADMVNKSQDALIASVVAARYSEVTWDDIGAQLGLTRQAAWKRFHRYLLLDPEPAASKGKKP